MKLPSNRTHLFFCVSFVVCFLVLPLLAASSGATNLIQQTSAVKGAQRPASDIDGSRSSSSGNRTLKFPVTVTGAKGGFLIGLTKDNFSVWEGKTQREINYFSSLESPASVGILIDVSGSVEPRTVQAARYAAARFIKQGYEKNEYLIGEFNNMWRASSGKWQDGPATIEALNNLVANANSAQSKQKPRGQTALYDALDAALDEVTVRPNERHVLLLFTDGQDNESRTSFNQLRRKIQTSDVLIYGINIYESHESAFLNQAGQAILDELAMNSGGWAFFPDNKKDGAELNAVIDRIALELRHQYVIGFTPTDAAPAGKWNKVKIKLTPPDQSLKNLSLRTREGYFSPTATP